MIKSILGYSKNTNSEEASQHREKTSQGEFERVFSNSTVFLSKWFSHIYRMRNYQTRKQIDPLIYTIDKKMNPYVEKGKCLMIWLVWTIITIKQTNGLLFKSFYYFLIIQHYFPDFEIQNIQVFINQISVISHVYPSSGNAASCERETSKWAQYEQSMTYISRHTGHSVPHTGSRLGPVLKWREVLEGWVGRKTRTGLPPWSVLAGLDVRCPAPRSTQFFLHLPGDETGKSPSPHTARPR